MRFGAREVAVAGDENRECVAGGPQPLPTSYCRFLQAGPCIAGPLLLKKHAANDAAVQMMRTAGLS